MSEIKVTKANFEEEVLNSKVPVLVDFWAVWCGPCMMLAPALSEIAEEGKVKVAKINVDEEGELAIKFNVMSIPTVMLFENGQVVKKTVGYMSKEELEAELGI